MESKKCAKCKEQKPVAEFSKMIRAKDGLHSYCRECNREYSRKRYEQHGDKMRAAHKTWLAENREHCKEYSRNYNKGSRGSGRGAYERAYSSGLRRQDFESDYEFGRSLNNLGVKNRAARNKFYVDQIKTKPCLDCGRTFDPVCMDFDHLSDNKDTEVSKMVGKGASIEKIQAEIDKCELVCACCHRLRTKRRSAERRAT